MKLPTLHPVEVKLHKPTEVMRYAEEYGKACARAALEEAAKVCDARVFALDVSGNQYRREGSATQCGSAIRAIGVE